MLKPLVPAFIALALLAGGCAAETIPESERIRIESSSSPLGPGSDFDKQRDKDAKAKKAKKARGNVVVVRKLGVKFKAPGGWVRIKAGDRAQIEAYAQSVGLSAKDVQTTMDAADVFLVGSPGSLVVATSDSGGPLPSKREFRAALESDTLDVTSIEDVTTRFGKGLAAFYTQAFQGQTVHSVAVLVVVDNKGGYFTIATPDAGRTRTILGTLTRTLSRS